MVNLSVVGARLIAVVRARHQPGDFRATVDGVSFPQTDYATACALYEAARGTGRDAAIVDDFRLELVRRSWGSEQASDGQ